MIVSCDASKKEQPIAMGLVGGRVEEGRIKEAGVGGSAAERRRNHAGELAALEGWGPRATPVNQFRHISFLPKEATRAL